MWGLSDSFLKAPFVARCLGQILSVVLAVGCTGEQVSLGDGHGDLQFTPFSAPVRLDTLSVPDSHDDDPSLTGDRLEIFFSSERDSEVANIWTSLRTDVAEPWPAPTVVAELSSESDDGSCAVSSNGKVIYVSSERAGGAGRQDIWRFTRASRDDAWGTAEPVVELSTEFDEVVRAVDDQETQVLFGRRTEMDTFDLQVATRAAIGEAWVESDAFESVNTDGHEADPYLIFSSGVLFFTFGDEQRGDEIFSAALVGGEYGDATAVEELNSDSDDSDPWVSPDGLTVVFASERDQERLSLFEAVRAPR